MVSGVDFESNKFMNLSAAIPLTRDIWGRSARFADFFGLFFAQDRGIGPL